MREQADLQEPLRPRPAGGEHEDQPGQGEPKAAQNGDDRHELLPGVVKALRRQFGIEPEAAHEPFPEHQPQAFPQAPHQIGTDVQIGDFLQERQGLRPRPDEQVGGIQDDPRHAHDDVQPEQPQRAERPGPQGAPPVPHRLHERIRQQGEPREQQKQPAGRVVPMHENGGGRMASDHGRSPLSDDLPESEGQNNCLTNTPMTPNKARPPKALTTEDSGPMAASAGGTSFLRGQSVGVVPFR